MKISKLFHWLYAFLMALPIFAILSACLISTFNMSSKQESEINYKYETNEVNYFSDLVDGNYYEFNRLLLSEYLFNNVGFNDDSSILFDYCLIEDNREYYLGVNADSFDSDFASPLYNGLFFEFGIESSSTYVSYGIQDAYLKGIDITGVYSTGSDIIYGRFNLGASNISYLDFTFNIGGAIKQCPLDKLPIESVEINNVETQDIFYNAIDKVKQSPLFSWAYNSNILGVPISYIGGIFGLASYSIVNVLLCYWVAISIIWLVFDILMFVPMLVHKSLDKMRF